MTSVQETTDPLYLPLCISMHALYGRPFKMQNTGEKLSEEYVRPNFEAMHLCLITLRDKLLVHTDGDQISAAGRPLHGIVYRNFGVNRPFSTNDRRPRLDYLLTNPQV